MIKGVERPAIMIVCVGRAEREKKIAVAAIKVIKFFMTFPYVFETLTDLRCRENIG